MFQVRHRGEEGDQVVGATKLRSVEVWVEPG